MHLHFEQNSKAKCDCNILSLSWMGKVPDELPEQDESWKLNRTNYYQEGWLASGNARGLIGVTFTTSHCRTRTNEFPSRANYNLRGHQSEVILVKWNEPYQKLASCDSSGVIFVWIKYDGRWSIELINDRSTPVTHFSWSHDGRMALICYRDGFVLVGSVAGQRYWSSMLNDQATITCGIWTPDDQQVYFGTTAGQLIVMDVHGAMVSEVQLGIGITSMAWSAEKFKMEEGDDDFSESASQSDERTHVLAVCLIDGKIIMMRAFDDVTPITINTGLKAPLHAEWSNSRKLLAIAGTVEDADAVHRNTQEYQNMLKFYSDSGSLTYVITIPYTQSSVSALTWGHNDRRLFVATGPRIHAAWVSRRVGSLQLLSRLAVRAALTHESDVQLLPLPPRLRALVAALFTNTIRSCVPDSRELRKFVSRPPPAGSRLHCTMLRHTGELAPCYTLYLEHLGGLVPLLKGRRTSKIRPEFVIFDPQTEEDSHHSDDPLPFHSFSDGSDIERDSNDSHGSPKSRRKHRRRKEDKWNEDADDLAYIDTLPEHARLVEVTSNIWGTKFKIHGLMNSVPANLGQVTYRTSLLHLQPRQMTLVMTELRDDLPAGPDPNFNPNLFSEDEEDIYQESHSAARSSTDSQAPPIAPMTPRNSHLHGNRSKSNILTPFSTADPLMNSSNLHSHGFDDDDSYIDMPNMIDRFDNLRPPSNSYRVPRHNPSRCCDVPTLQSPKNAVAPTQILIATSNSPSDYSHNIQRMKGSMTDIQTTRKDIENSKLNQSDERCSSNNSQVHAVPSLLQNAQNGISRTQSIMGGNNLPSHLIVNIPNVSSLMHQSYSPSYIHVKSNLNICSSNIQSFSSTNFNRNSLGLNHMINAPACSHHAVNVNYHLSYSSCHKRKESKSTGCCPKTTANHTSQVGMASGRTEELKFIDEGSREVESPHESVSRVRRTPTVVSIGPMCPALDPIVRSCSVGYLDSVDIPLVPCDVALTMLRREAPSKRLVLVSRKTKKRRKHKSHEIGQQYARIKLRTCGKSKSLDSSDMFASSELIVPQSQLAGHQEEIVNAIHDQLNPVENNMIDSQTDVIDDLINRGNALDLTGGNSIGEAKSSESLSSSLDGLAARLRDFDDINRLPPLSSHRTTRLPRSSPSSPAPSKKGKRAASASPIRRKLLSSPLLSRRMRKNRGESSDDESASQDESSKSYKNLETFQKAQLRQKLKQKLTNGSNSKAEELIMHNKAPMWNESSQVYQLDFGGRVTQESAKNFQIEYREKQVMQFGRIDGNAYTLDFQYPFSALQAFAVALANVTQRLK